MGERTAAAAEATTTIQRNPPSSFAALLVKKTEQATFVHTTYHLVGIAEEVKQASSLASIRRRWLMAA